MSQEPPRRFKRNHKDFFAGVLFLLSAVWSLGSFPTAGAKFTPLLPTLPRTESHGSQTTSSLTSPGAAQPRSCAPITEPPLANTSDISRPAVPPLPAKPRPSLRTAPQRSPTSPGAVALSVRPPKRGRAGGRSPGRESCPRCATRRPVPSALTHPTARAEQLPRGAGSAPRHGRCPPPLGGAALSAAPSSAPSGAAGPARARGAEGSGVRCRRGREPFAMPNLNLSARPPLLVHLSPQRLLSPDGFPFWGSDKDETS